MSASLVGSEMCIRDSLDPLQKNIPKLQEIIEVYHPKNDVAGGTLTERIPVSYTHLTLPTICSV
eukprot:6321187-Alexandrium_andersonii.AAC.1